MSPVLILIFIFCYVPMYGLLISFQDWTPGMPFMDFTGQTKWVGLKHFSTFVHDPYFWRLIKKHPGAQRHEPGHRVLDPDHFFAADQ